MMKKLILFSMFIIGVFSLNLNAQTLKVPSAADLTGSLNLPEDKAGFEKDFLAALDPGKDLGISAENLGKLATRNKSFVSDVMSIMGGKGSDNDKLAKIGAKNTELTKFVTGLLGESTAGKYFEKINKQLSSFKTKYKLAKMFM